MSYRVFHRTWWKENPRYPNGLEPEASVKHKIEDDVETEEEARAICKTWNSENEPGRLSDKAEFEEN